MAQKIIKNKDEYFLFLSFLQATGLVLYSSLVGIIFWKGNEWFPNMNPYLGPLLMLVIFVASALICGMIVFAYPLKKFFDDKKILESLKIVAYTSVWMFFYILFFLLVIFAF